MSLSHYAAYLLTALVLSLLFTPVMRALSYRTGALDRGTGRRVHDGVVPRLGGGGIYLAFVLPILFLILRYPGSPARPQFVGILIAATIVFAVGLYDDLGGAPIRNKLAAEVAAALVLYAWGIRIATVSNPFGGGIDLGWFSLPVTVLWVVVITNAINLVDGLDGLAAGTGILIALTLFLLTRGDIFLAVSYLALIGGLLGFLRYNFPPATIFMGDSGSLFVGFVLSALTMVSSVKAAAVVTLMVPILVFAHPLLDMVYAVLRRYHRGLPLGHADKEHIHHQLLGMGFSRRKALWILMGVNVSVLAVAGFVAHRQFRGDFILLALILALGVVGLKGFGYIEFRPFFRSEARVLTMDRRRRYLLYLIRDFRRGLPQIRSEEELSARAAALFLDSGLASAELHLAAASGESRVIRYGDVRPGGMMRLEYPALNGREVVGAVVLLAPADQDPPACAPEIGAALAEAVSVLLALNAGADRPQA